MNSLAKVALVAVTALGATFATPAEAQSPALFNTIEYRTNDLNALPKWQATLGKIAKERKTYANSRSKAVRAWQTMIQHQQGKRPVDQLRQVNRFINQWRYRSDQYNYALSLIHI